MNGIVLATINAKWIHPSLALRLLKANLGELEGQCEILEFALRQPLKKKVEPILAARPRLLGFSVSIWNHLATLELLKTLETKWEEKPALVLGGPEVSWLPEEAEIFRYADFVIRGEGEESFRSLCFEFFNGNRSKPWKVGAVFIGEGETKVNLNWIASPYRLYTNEDIQRKLLYVEASRGCPYGCEFCQGPVMRNNEIHKVREFPLEPFLADMGILIEKGGRVFKFLDRTFNLDIDRALRIMEFFLDEIIARTLNRTKAHPFCVHFEMVPFRFPKTLRDLIRRFPPGTLRLEIGIQTFNPKAAALIQLSGKPEEKLETLEFLRRETNAIIHVDLIAGLPGEDFSSFGAGFNRLWQAVSAAPSGGHFEIQLGILKCLPGTPIIRHTGAYGMRYSAAPSYEVIETGTLSAAELGSIKNFARFWEIIVNRNPFPDLLPSLLPQGEPVFERFMGLSDKLLEKFGRNWGIDRKELRFYLENSILKTTAVMQCLAAK